MKSLAPNTLIQNRYLIVQLIGKGGMGEVYLAVDQRLGSAVALKRMLFTDEEALGQAFEREAKTLARLRHPALTKVSDHFNENGMQYLVMEHISGDDLSKRLEQNQKPFPLSWVLFWADQLLDALHYLHSHEPPIIHRDIKPQNLKLTTDNHIILLDFGLAKDSVGETRLSTTGNVIAFTPNYASMEQIRGTGTTGKSDLYALSATMYQLLSNNVPADALSRADSVLNSLPDPITPLHELNPEVAPVISNIIMKGMSLSAEQRFANAKEMQLALREAYAQLQQGMSANTVAFNTTEQPQITNQPIVQSDIKTEQFSMPNVSVPVGEKTEVMPVGLTAENVISTDPPANFDATIPYGTPFTPELESSPVVADKTEVIPPEVSSSFGFETQVSPIDYSFPSGEKTEVISSEDIGPIIEKSDFVPFTDSVPTGEKTEVFAADATAQNMSGFDDFSGKQAETFDYPESPKEESYTPEMTVPLVNYGDQISELPNNETSNFVSIPPNQTETFKAEETPAPIINEVKEEPKKKAAAGGGGSKVLMIVGILAVLAFLGIGAAGAGLYVFMPELFGITTPTPTAQPTPESITTPSITPTPEPTLEANSNTDNGSNSINLTNTNTNTGDNTSNNNQPSDKPIIASDKTPQPNVEKTVQPNPQPTRQQPNPQPTKPQPQPTKPQTNPQPTKPVGKPTVNPKIIE